MGDKHASDVLTNPISNSVPLIRGFRYFSADGLDSYVRQVYSWAYPSGLTHGLMPAQFRYNPCRQLIFRRELLAYMGRHQFVTKFLQPLA